MGDPAKDGFIMLGDHVVSLDRDELPEEFKQLAERELRETPEIRDAAVETLKEMVRGEPDLYLPEHRTDAFILYLRACKFYPEEAFGLMKRYYKFKLNNPKLCQGILPSKEQNAFLSGVVTAAPERDRHGRRILIVHGGERWDPSKCNVYDFIRGVIMVVKVAVFEPKTQVAGGVVIVDLEGMGLTQAIQVSPRLASTILNLIQECMPIRLKAIHLVNQPYIFNMVYAIFKPFMDEKLKSRLHFHGPEREELIKDIGAKYLPVKYGGDLDLPEIPGEQLHRLFCHLEEEYKAITAFGYRPATKRQVILEEDLPEID